MGVHEAIMAANMAPMLTWH